MLHEIENNPSSENHLKDNGEKFNRHCVEVLKLLYQGKRLNARQLETEYGYDGRRIRDVAANRKDVKKQWVRSAEGKTRYVEYWLDLPLPPTKQKAIAWATEFLDKQQKIAQPTLF